MAALLVCEATWEPGPDFIREQSQGHGWDLQREDLRSDQGPMLLRLRVHRAVLTLLGAVALEALAFRGLDWEALLRADIAQAALQKGKPLVSAQRMNDLLHFTCKKSACCERSMCIQERATGELSSGYWGPGKARGAAASS